MTSINLHHLIHDWPLAPDPETGRYQCPLCLVARAGPDSTLCPDKVQATILNETGRGEGPSPGWTWDEENDDGWHRVEGDYRLDVNLGVDAGAPRWHAWVISGSYEAPVIHWSGWFDTAREAMVAADAALSGLRA